MAVAQSGGSSSSSAGAADKPPRHLNSFRDNDQPYRKNSKRHSGIGSAFGSATTKKFDYIENGSALDMLIDDEQVIKDLLKMGRRGRVVSKGMEREV